jgi:hypothetical protein
MVRRHLAPFVLIVVGCSSPLVEPSVEWPTREPSRAEAPWKLTASDGSGLEVVRVDAKAVVEGPLAFTELHLYFRNGENRTREGRFAITLPNRAAVSRFAMEIGGHMQEAEVVPKQRARRVYEDFLHRKQDPALLEKSAGNEFTARVFPIPALSDKHLVISFSQELAGEYVLPLRGLPTVEQLDVRVVTTRLDGSPAIQEIHERRWQPDRDFTVGAATTTAVGAGGLVAMQIAPNLTATQADPPTSLTLLVDTSASRARSDSRPTSTRSASWSASYSGWRDRVARAGLRSGRPGDLRRAILAVRFRAGRAAPPSRGRRVRPRLCARVGEWAIAAASRGRDRWCGDRRARAGSAPRHRLASGSDRCRARRRSARRAARPVARSRR